MNITPENITELQPNEVFVFGSNMAGKHGAGAAKLALKFGAVMGIGFGLHGQSFAIPTKDAKIKTLPLEVVAEQIQYFRRAIDVLHDRHFLITAIGCGLAGYTAKDIAPLFKDFVNLPNVSLPKSFWDVLQPSTI
jgi:hypothetical protein